MRVDILLTHHGTHQLDRCIKVGSAYLCARCAGMYPAMALGLWATLSGRMQMSALASGVLSVLGVTAWGADRLLTPRTATPSPARRPSRVRAANVLRSMAGAVLGLSLGDLLARHFVEPFVPRVVVQIVLIVTVAAGFGLVDLLARRAVRKLRDCDENRSTGAELP